MWIPFTSPYYDTQEEFKNSFWCEKYGDYTPQISLRTDEFRRNCIDHMLIHNAVCTLQERLWLDGYGSPGYILMNIMFYDRFRGFECEKCKSVTVHDQINEIIAK